MNDQIRLQLRIENPDAEAHNHGNQSGPNHRRDQYLLERMARRKVDDTGAADNLGEDENKGNRGQHQRLRPRPRVAQRLRDDNGDDEVERGGQHLRSEGI